MLRRTREWLAGHLPELTEAGFVLLALAGLVLLVGLPWALIAGGVLGAVACERASSRGAQPQVAGARRLRVPGPRSEQVA